MIVGRIQVDGAADLPAVHALQDQFTVTRRTRRRRSPASPRRPTGVADDLLWWERLRVALAAFPPPAGDAPFWPRSSSSG